MGRDAEETIEEGTLLGREHRAVMVPMGNLRERECAIKI